MMALIVCSLSFLRMGFLFLKKNPAKLNISKMLINSNKPPTPIRVFFPLLEYYWSMNLLSVY